MELGNHILEVDDMEVEEVMIPLKDICRVRADTPAFAAGRELSRQGRMRALLIDSKGRFIGKMFSVNSVLRAPETGKLCAGDCARTVPVLERSETVPAALTRLRRAGAPLALVSNAKGAFIGALTLNSLVACVVSGVDRRKWNL